MDKPESNKKLLFTLSLCLLFILIHLGIPDRVNAQPELWDGEDSQETPIDGGLGILAALGGAYGIKKLREKE